MIIIRNRLLTTYSKKPDIPQNEVIVYRMTIIITGLGGD